MKRRMVRIDGDDYEVMDEGNCFIETKRHRYSWREGELRRFVARDIIGNPDKDGKREPELDWGHDSYTGRDILELYGDDYDKGRGHECWVRLAGVEEPLKIPSPNIEDASTIPAEISRNGDSVSYGKLTVYGDFESVIYAKNPHDLTDANNAQNILRFLCTCAVGKSKAKSKADIRKHVNTVNADWRPSQDFRGQLKPLFECIGSNRGMYWIKD